MHFVLPNHSAVKEIMLLLFQQGWLLQFYILRYCIIVLEMYIYSQALLGIATCQPSFLSAQEVIWILSWPHNKNVGLDLDMGPLMSLSCVTSKPVFIFVHSLSLWMLCCL